MAPPHSYLHVSHRCCETVVLGTCLKPLEPQRSLCAFVLLCFVLCALCFVLRALCFVLLCRTPDRTKRATRVHAHATAVGAHRRNARKCPRRLARSSERTHMGQTEAKKGMSLRALYTELRKVKNIRRLESAQQSLHPLALRTVLPRRLGRGAAVFRRRSWATRRATGVRSEDAGPCRRFPAAPGSAAGIRVPGAG